VPLVRKTPDGTYLQAVTNGKGPYKIVNDGWLSFVRTTNLGSRYFGAVASFNSPDIKPRAVRLRAYFQPVIIQDGRFPAADYGGILIGDSPDYTSGSCSITLPCGTQATLSVALETITFPSETNEARDWGYPFRFELFYPGGNLARDNIGDFMPVCENPFLYASVRAGKEVGQDQLFAFPGADSWPASEPPGLFAYDATRTLTIGSDARLVTSGPYSFYPVGQGDATGYPSSHEAGVRVSCQAIESHEPDEPCRVTLWMPRGGSGAEIFSASHAGYTHGDDRPAWAAGAYTNVPIKHVDGQRITITRDGTEVLSGVRPSDESVTAATGEDGSYLIVSEVDQASDPEDAPAARSPKFLKDYASFVVDTRPPVIGWSPPNDEYMQNAWRLDQPWNYVYATEPVFRTGSQYAWGGANGWHKYKVDGARPGAVTVTSYTADTVSDYAGNRPEVDGECEVMVHANPSHNHFGPIPKLTVPHDPRNGKHRQPNQGLRPAVNISSGVNDPVFDWPFGPRQSPVTSVLLQFDRVVNESQVQDFQITLTKDGEQVGGYALSPYGDGRRWTISLANSNWPVNWRQTPRSFWVLTYDPGGWVYSQDIVTKHFATRDSFPEPVYSNSNKRTIYVDSRTGAHYRRTGWLGTYNSQGQPLCAYEEILPGSPPVDFYGNPYAEEPSVLAARAAWLMADDVPVPQLIDTSASHHYQAIGRVVSVGEDSTLSDATDVAVETQGGVFLETDIVDAEAANTDEGIVGLGAFRTAEVDGFLPQVPPTSITNNRYGYFGIGTTIDPSPPGLVSICAAPTAGQPHSSAIISVNDITAFSATIVARDESGAEISTDQPVYLNGYWYDNEGYETNFPTHGLNPDPTVTVQPDALPIAAYNGETHSFGIALSGSTLSQNTWQATTAASTLGMDIQGDFERDANGDPIMGEDGKPTYVPATGGGTTLTGTITQDQMYAVATAFRCAKEFTAMKTATLGELVMVIRFRMLCKADLTVTERDMDGNVTEENNQIKRAFRGFTASCVFSKEQEVAFADGGPVYFPVQSYWVKLQKS
jgi:hypothetical protein